ncbi:AGE family epimerase/isomerase [Roseicyclus sp. F158]|uniref:AGE family epimerase/isomerase n=1 Tax=Tropicimonas omnivorans TaxID=3075590 RepID=A0ABU3DFY7_9RHOB|nr:AGE family epimerase/isomerase [Roseicyclus sp. F158]MDT0682469.1 AGE family epimerase/isomerase [Roseicyclus sp. F158]
MTPSALLRWMNGTALPLWAAHGVEADGGFAELLTADLRAIARPRRARLTARQVYVFASGARLGWEGAGLRVARSGLEILSRKFVRLDGTVVPRLDPDGRAMNARHDLYDDAFVLFALAALSPDPAAEALARRVTLALADRSLAGGGYSDGHAGPGRRLANPHMHLFEAAIAWAATGRPGPWRGMASGLSRLARQRLIQRSVGVIPEVYAADWTPVPDADGLLIEPGHLFEWGWLLIRWGRMSDDKEAVADGERLGRTAETHGLAADGTVLDALNERLEVRARGARLWPQAERAKFWQEVASCETGAKRADAILRRDCALRALGRFLSGPRPGLWREVRQPDGTFVEEPVRASSLYHIVSAADVMAGAVPVYEEVLR